MNDARLDSLARAEAPGEKGRITRRVLLQALGLGASAAVAGGVGLERGLAARAAVARQDDGRSIPPPQPRPPGGPTVDQVAFEHAYGPEGIFRFVRDEVAYEAYGGALRGAKGTLWGLAGNSVDQALLLAALLNAALVETRFVVGELDDAAATSLVDAMRLDAATARERADRVSAAGAVTLDRHPGLTPEQRAALQSPAELRQHLLERAGTRLEAGLATIDAALAAEAISLPEPTMDLPERERRQHVWVQYAAGPQWIDLDPTFASAEPGTAVASPIETWDAVPDDLFHLVEFRAIVEKNAAGEAVREESLAFEARATDLVGVPVVFAHIPPNSLRDLGVAIGGLVEGSIQYIPSLLAGDEGKVGSPVTLMSAGGGVLDVFGTTESDGEAIAEWLEIEVLSPDEPPRHLIREVFDRVGVDRRAAGAIDLASLPPVELTDDPKLGHVFSPLEAVWVVGVVGGRIPGSYFEQDYAIENPEADMALLVFGYHAARDRLQIEVAAGHGYRWYHDEPNLTAAIVAPVAVGREQFAISASLDVIHQGYGLVPITGETPTVHPLVLAGVLAHVAEVAGTDAAEELTPEAPPPESSVAHVFEEAARAGLAIRTVTPETTDLSTLAVSDIAKARIGEALAAGYLVVVPERAVTLDGVEQVGWWQVDPDTGRTFDLMENGRGAFGITENTVIIVGGPAWRAAFAWKVLSFVIGVIVGISATMAFLTYPN
jgi:hypothetical protein